MNDEMCNFYIMYFYDATKYSVEPPNMCSWGGLDDMLKFPPGSDKLDSKVENHVPVPGTFCCLLSLSFVDNISFVTNMVGYVYSKFTILPP